MSIVYERNTKEIIYYIYKSDSPGYGISMTRRTGETAMLASFAVNLQDAVNFIAYLRRHKVCPENMKEAARKYRELCCQSEAMMTAS